MKSQRKREAPTGRGPNSLLLAAVLLATALLPGRAPGQAYGEPDRGAPGDAMIQEYLRQATEKVESEFLGDIKTTEDWNKSRPRFRHEYFDMLGLWPLPEKTPLQATITRTLDRSDYVVDMLHFQSRPGLYVTGNLYRPAKAAQGERRPAVLYVCGHSPRPRNGNKTAYQSHGIWFARHGYVCLVLDTLEMGELTCTHHGTYRDGRWWWLSRGYTPAGVECWNGIRGLDYLASRPDVDPEHLGVTGISGGGAATFWITAGDERVKASVPVSGWSDLLAHVPNRVVNGHCDCMFFYNTYQWPLVRVPAMIAPRPLLFVNSDADAIFPMDGNDRLINRLERIYSLFGAGDRVDSVVSVGGHAYRQDIRQAAFRFLNTFLKGDSRPVTDSEVDLVTTTPPEVHPIPPEELRVFRQDSEFPSNAINARIDELFVPVAKPDLPAKDQFPTWKNERMATLRELAFHHFPKRLPAATALDTNAAGIVRLVTEAPIEIRLKPLATLTAPPRRIWLVPSASSLDDPLPATLKDSVTDQDSVYVCEPRGVGASRWTTKNPPNYVERSHYLLGRTVDSGRVWDVVAAAEYLSTVHQGRTPVYLAGEGAAAVWSVYAALLAPDIAGLALSHPPASHLDPSAPSLLNVLRVLDIPLAIGMVAPRPVTLVGAPAECRQTAAAIYQAANASDRLSAR